MEGGIKKYTGVVKFYNFKSGYGFIVGDHDQQDIFFHKSSVKTNYDAGRPFFPKSCQVAYVLKAGKAGPEADQITRSDGTPLGNYTARNYQQTPTSYPPPPRAVPTGESAFLINPETTIENRRIFPNSGDPDFQRGGQGYNNRGMGYRGAFRGNNRARGGFRNRGFPREYSGPKDTKPQN